MTLFGWWNRGRATTLGHASWQTGTPETKSTTFGGGESLLVFAGVAVQMWQNYGYSMACNCIMPLIVMIGNIIKNIAMPKSYVICRDK